MYISKIDIHDFRAFQKPFSMELGRYVTVISGLNGIGKSTILAILTNCAELKSTDGKLLNGSPFRGDFKDIIMYDSANDTSGDKATIYFEDIPSSKNGEHFVRELTFRATTQKSSTNMISYRKDKDTDLYHKKINKKTNYRYRLIPKHIKGIWENNSKIKWPSYYLGLSRIYPIGETDQAKEQELPKEFSDTLIKKHAEILSERLPFNENKPSFKNVAIDNVTKSKSGINTDQYSATSNSSGQDNLGQILLTFLSFKQLKESLKENYHGGILAIDELDATLHPAAQNRLFDFILQQAKKLNLQVVFTTHSLTLLEHISKKIGQKGIGQNDIKISYLRTEADKPGEVIESVNPNPDFFRYNLTQTFATSSHFRQKVSVLMEDEVARNFCQLIFAFSNHKELEQLSFPDVQISWSHLINLLNSIPNHLRDVICILDPDLNDSSQKELNKRLKTAQSPVVPNDSHGNLFVLPGNAKIEEMMFNYIKSLQSDSDFYKDETVFNSGYDYDRVHEQLDEVSKGTDKNKIKHWFNENTQYIETLEKYWILDHKDEVKSFCDKVYSAFKRIQSNLEKTI